MVHRWTDDYKGSRDFLSNLIPDYVAAQENKTGLKDKFYPMVTANFKEKFPQVPTAAEVAKYGKEQAQEVADKRLFDRIRQWFPNNTRPGSRACQVKEETPAPQAEKSTSKSGARHGRQRYSKSCINIMPATRMLQPSQAYQKLFYKGALKEEYLAAREAYLKRCKEENTAPAHSFTYRNQWFKERFESETEAVKAEVEAYRINESKQMSDSEEDAVARSARYARGIPKLPKTLEGICETISKETGWSVSIIVGGPHPTYGGKIATLSRHFGRTPDGRSYEEFLGDEEYKRQVALFDDFLLESFDEDKRQEVAIEDKTGPVTYDNESDDEGGDDDDETETMADQSPNTSSSTKSGQPSEANGAEPASKQPKKSAMGQLSEYEITKQRNIARNAVLLAEVGLSGGASKLIGSTRRNKDQSSEKTKAGEQESNVESEDQGSTRTVPDGSEEASVSASASAAESLPEPPSSESPSPKTALPAPISVPRDASPVSIAPTTNTENFATPDAQRPQVIQDTNFTVNRIDEPIDIDGAMSAGRNPEGSKAKENGAQEMVTNYPIPPHVSSLWDYLLDISECRRWRDLLHGYLKFEATAPTSGSMPTTMRPAEVALWMKRHRKAETPKDIDADDFEQRLLAWWHSLQPDWRISSATSAPGTYKRDADGGLDGFRKGGPNGILLVIIAMGWWISSHGDRPLGIKVDEALADVIWVLGKVTNTNGAPSGGEDAAGRPKREKRKGEGISVTTKRPRRA